MAQDSPDGERFCVLYCLNKVDSLCEFRHRMSLLLMRAKAFKSYLYDLMENTGTSIATWRLSEHTSTDGVVPKCGAWTSYFNFAGCREEQSTARLVLH
jgi:hypothetical protein